MKKKQDGKTRIKTAAVSTAVAATMLMGSLTQDMDGLSQDMQEQLTPHTAVMMMVQDEPPTQVADEDKKQKQNPGKFAQAIQRICAWPVAVKLMALCPVWFGGKLLISLLAGLASAVGGPLLGVAVEAGLDLALLGGTVAVAHKAVCPDVPLKQLVTKRNIGGLLAGTVLLVTADCTLPLLWRGYPVLKAATVAVFGTGASWGLWRWSHKKQMPEVASAQTCKVGTGE